MHMEAAVWFVFIVVVVDIDDGGGGCGGCGGGVIGISFFAHGVLVVMHPYFKNPSFNSNLIAKISDQILVSLLHFPSHLFCKMEHFFLLFVAEFRPESFPSV